MTTFSIVTPVHLWSDDRVKKFEVCAQSVRNQKFKDFEWIVIDDGSAVDYLWNNIVDIATTIIHQPHLERINALNAGFKEVKGDWIVLLDSDDELDPEYLSTFYSYINRFPKAKMFNCGAKYIHIDGRITERGPFKPKKKKVGHEIFGPGNIVNGTFVFSKAILDDLGAFPPMYIENVDCSKLNYGGVRRLAMSSPYDFSAAAQLEFPELQQFFFIDRAHDPNKAIKELGNPWGQDNYLFYKYTRKYHSISFNKNLYLVHPR